MELAQGPPAIDAESQDWKLIYLSKAIKTFTKIFPFIVRMGMQHWPHQGTFPF